MSETPRQKILCIEDNPVNWRLVQRLLSQAGFDLHWAEEGMSGYQMALDLKPDLVLLDINLPGLSGFEVATKFRQHPDLKTIPIVALTAKTLKSDRETALVVGCDGFIPKPIDPFTFTKQVTAYLGGQRERIEKSREEAVLRQFNVQMLEHLEQKLAEAQEANTKLQQAQRDLELRNQSLSRLVALSQDILSEHDPEKLLRNVLDHSRTEVKARSLHAFRMHPSRGFLEGIRWNGKAYEVVPGLNTEHSFMARLRVLMAQGSLLHGEKLKATKLWEEGIALSVWQADSETAMILLKDRQNEEELWGFWTFCREASQPFQPSELEVMALCASMALVSLENAELILNLSESSRALASSYERLETSYQDLQRARAALQQEERQGLLADLFVKISQRLEVPVASLHQQSEFLDEVILQSTGPGYTQDRASGSLREVREAVSKIDQLLKALLRRVGKDQTALPEWLNLHTLLQQELELMQAENLITADVAVHLDLQAEKPQVYGVYGDFAKIFQNLIQHGMESPFATPSLELKTWREAGTFHLEIRDQAGPIVPQYLETAFEPFSQLHQETITGVRSPGEGLPVCKQLLATYHGSVDIRNEGEGTALHISFPLV